MFAVNADEGEPGTFKDRYYLERDPHRFIEGVLIAACVSAGMPQIGSISVLAPACIHCAGAPASLILEIQCIPADLAIALLRCESANAARLHVVKSDLV